MAQTDMKLTTTTALRDAHTIVDIVCVHGFGGSTFDYERIADALERECAGCRVHYFSYKERFGTVRLEVLANRLVSFVQQHTMKKVVFIGISQGGVICSLCAKDKRLTADVLGIATVCTPFYGTFWALFWFFVGVKELRHNSGVLDDVRAYLHKAPFAVLSIWNPCDEVVLPGWHARLPSTDNRIRCVRVVTAGHAMTFINKRTVSTIVSWTKKLLVRSSK